MRRNLLSSMTCIGKQLRKATKAILNYQMQKSKKLLREIKKGEVSNAEITWNNQGE